MTVDAHIQFQISVGELSSFDANGTQSTIGPAYAGAIGYVNDPTATDIPDKGPIPVGWYSIGAATEEKGPLTLPLTPDPETDMFGRSGFLVHGSDAAKDVNGLQASSEGCIVCDRQIRVVVATFTRLLVVP